MKRVWVLAGVVLACCGAGLVSGPPKAAAQGRGSRFRAEAAVDRSGLWRGWGVFGHDAARQERERR